MKIRNAESVQEAREFHESENAQADVLRALRAGGKIVGSEWNNGGSRRVANVIDRLRNYYGFDIEGDGKPKTPYLMDDPLQNPPLVPVTEEIKEAYYRSKHWRGMANQRMERDNFECVLCGSTENLEVHHFCYRLFKESLSELLTVCDFHHRMIHENSKIKFPGGITRTKLASLGFPSRWPEWALVR